MDSSSIIDDGSTILETHYREYLETSANYSDVENMGSSRAIGKNADSRRRRWTQTLSVRAPMAASVTLVFAC